MNADWVCLVNFCIKINEIWKLCNLIVENSHGFEQGTWGISPSNWTWPKRRTGNEKQTTKFVRQSHPNAHLHTLKAVYTSISSC